MTEEKFVSVKEIARVLTVSPATIYRWVSQGIIPVYRFGKTWRFSVDEIIKWAKQKN